ncbi:serine/threonine-protein kinase [Accumulibacter sp.]|uniref:serine/threonine-protein kinase n=1 Tax=Accumulibacter sp. TaxID=2053492 RepID=UPI0025F7A370|nr:serine/threonine-protein kinase [Accumulibacter sp.]MCM8614275.1 serine/threonine-protein kinase [Accumulibacter sp.]MCM8638071.1 serine/threonine-protein kinase [Accumulibacter sp.]MCM8641444.1 serine/threonine-protein kinase [Accumulibacter sp.]
MPEPDNDKTLVLGGSVAPAPRTGSTTRIGKSNNALPIGTHLSEFEIVDLVGEGGFGIVYLAADHSLERRVAIKEYMPSSLAMRADDLTVVVRSERHSETFDVGRRSFVNEARLLAQFDHPALVKVFRFWEANGTAYMAMPYYAGTTLRDVLQRMPERPDESWIRKILAPIMDALELIHNADCFHRDIAPDNIMLLKDDRPVLLDFGAARRVISGMTQALTVILKPGFAPIEQYADMPGVRQGPWTDIYALAAVVHSMITGQVPPPSVNRVMRDTYQPLSEAAAGRYSDQFLRAIDQCLAVRGEDRPQSIAEMAQLLGPDPAAATATTLLASEETTILPATGATHVPMQRTEPLRPVPQPPVAKEPAIAGATARRHQRRPGSVPAVSAIAAIGVVAAAAGAYFFLTGKGTAPTTAPAQPASPTASIEKPVAITPAAKPVSLGEAFAIALEGSDRDFELRVDLPKTPVAVGRDVLSFALSSKRRGYLYVLLWDQATGHLKEIFPNPLDRDNQVAPGTPFRFPRPHWGYEADQPVGNWDVLAIVSESQRNFPFFAGAGANGSVEVAVATLERELRESPTGGTALTGEVICDSGRECSRAYAAARFVVTEVERRANEIASGRKPKSDQPASAKEGPGKSGDQRLDKMLEEMLQKR